MNSDQDLKVNESVILTDKEIFIKIWVSPRLVFKYINDTRYDKYIHVFLILGGIARAFDRATLKNMGDETSLIGVLSICIIFGGLFGWVTYYIYAALMSWTGKWLNGKGNTDSLLRMISYSMIPSIVFLAIVMFQVVLFGNGIFKSEFDVLEKGFLIAIIFYLSMLIEVVMALWAIVIMVVGISEIQKLSIGKSILNLILPALIIIVPLITIALIINLFR